MRCIRSLTLVMVLLAGGAAAQTAAPAADAQTLAEIRAEITGLAGEIALLRQELVAVDPQVTGVVNPEPLVVRVEAAEAELAQLTGQLEALQLRIERIVADGTNRIGDLEFRLTELEGGDISLLGDTALLGGTEGAGPLRPMPRGDAAPAAGSLEQPDTGLPQVEPPQLAVTEQAAYDEAYASFQAGDYAGAAAAFESFLTTYPGGPLSGEAAFWRGEALAAQGDWNGAARSFLDSFSGTPGGERAPEALYRLGLSLGKLGQTDEACLTLAEVSNRYPQMAPELAERTASEQRALSCS